MEVEETFAYDLYGNVVNKTAKVLDYNASSYGIAYEYDHGGNVTRMTYIPASLVLQNETVTGVISYSAADSITVGPAYTVASGASVVLQAGKKVILKPGFTAVQGSYFNAKIDAALTQDATVVTYSYDALGRLISVGTPSDADYYASYTYHADSRLFKEIFTNGAETRDHFYNSPGWLLRIDGDRFTEDITHTTGWSGAAGYYDGRIKTTSFTYNWAGKPTDYAVQYTYDDVGQLTSADNNLNNAWDIGIGNTISYDANGNILDLRRGSNTKTYAYYTGTNKVQNTDGSGNDYVYDSNANVNSSSPKSINTITYDAFTQRPVSVIMSSGTSLTVEYGGGTQRVLKNYNNGMSTNSRLYLHGANDYPLIEKNKTSATAETLAVYVYGLNGAIAKRVGSTVLFPLKDHLGSTRVVMDANGLVRTYYDYDALGNVIRIGTTNEVKYQFTSQEYDESGLHNYRARLYDSDLGKFYAADPAGQFASPYLYAGNNSISFVDPDGEFIIEAIIAANLIYSTVQGYRAGGLQGAFGAFVQTAVITGITMGAAGPVGNFVYGATGSATLSLAASSTVSSSLGSFMSGQGFRPTTDFGFGSIDWRGGGFRSAFSGRGFLSNAADAWSIYGSTLHDALLVGQKIQHAFSSEARANLAHAKGQMTSAKQSAEDPTKYNLDEKVYSTDEISDQDYWDAKAEFAPNAKNRSTMIDPFAPPLGFPPDVQKSASGEHIRGYRTLGGAHYGYDRVKSGVYRWRVHIDRFDPLALGGLAGIGHWSYESVNFLVRAFRARAIWGYGY